MIFGRAKTCILCSKKRELFVRYKSDKYICAECAEIITRSYKELASRIVSQIESQAERDKPDS